jgi:hypothetical protein
MDIDFLENIIIFFNFTNIMDFKYLQNIAASGWTIPNMTFRARRTRQVEISWTPPNDTTGRAGRTQQGLGGLDEPDWV